MFFFKMIFLKRKHWNLSLAIQVKLMDNYILLLRVFTHLAHLFFPTKNASLRDVRHGSSFKMATVPD
jgi:hypothetical protein